MSSREKVFWTIYLVAVAIAVAWLVLSPAKAEASEPVMVMQYNDTTRIVLSNKPCPMMQGALLAVAQRIDKQFIRGCFTYEPVKKLVRIQWSADDKDFSMFDADRFKPAEVEK